MRILLVENDTEFATWLAKALAQSGIAVDWCSGLMDDASHMPDCERFDVVVLGLASLARDEAASLNLRHAVQRRVPMLVLMAHDTLDEERRRRYSWADDFLAIPCCIAELEMCLRRLHERCYGAFPFDTGDRVRVRLLSG